MKVNCHAQYKGHSLYGSKVGEISVVPDLRAACIMPFCVMPICVMPFFAIPICVIPFRVVHICVMPFRVMPICVMPFTTSYAFLHLTSCVIPETGFCPSASVGCIPDLEHRIGLLLFWIDACTIWII